MAECGTQIERQQQANDKINERGFFSPYDVLRLLVFR